MPAPVSAPVSMPASDAWRAFVWPALGLAGLAVLLAAVVLWRRRQPRAAKAKVPQIELLLVTPEAEAEPPAPAKIANPPAPAAKTGRPLELRIDVTPSHLTRSMMTATLACRVSLTNRGALPMDDVAVELDLTTAHGSVPSAEQLADPARALPQAGRIARIAVGETVDFAHEVRLPTAEIRTIRQGEAFLYVPLLRVRAQASGGAPVARTFIVGTLPEVHASKLQPFRLDEMPQTYRLIGVAGLD